MHDCQKQNLYYQTAATGKPTTVRHTETGVPENPREPHTGSISTATCSTFHPISVLRALDSQRGHQGMFVGSDHPPGHEGTEFQMALDHAGRHRAPAAVHGVDGAGPGCSSGPISAHHHI